MGIIGVFNDEKYEHSFIVEPLNMYQKIRHSSQKSYFSSTI